jgi:hypothetical protein
MTLQGNSEVSKYLTLVKEAGKATLNSIFPNDFELYMLSLELVNSKGKTEDFFVFPVMPDSIEQRKGYIQNIYKTFGGVTVLTTNTFTVDEISLKGNFGKKLRMLIGSTVVSANAFDFSSDSTPTEFSAQIKTGYGCIKVLERICDKSKQTDKNGNPYSLLLYNPAIGNHYSVEVVNLSFPQSIDKNMIWQYNLTLNTVAPLSGLRKGEDIIKSLIEMTSFALISKGITALAGDIMNGLRTNISTNI